MKWTGLGALAVAGALVVSGCAPAAAPSPMCTPEAGGAEYACSQAEFEQMQAKDALYAEAEGVNRTFRTMMERIYREGAPAEFPSDLEAITGGSARDDIAAELAELHGTGVRVVGGEIKEGYVRRNVGAEREGSDVSLSVCMEAPDTMVHVGGVPLAPGVATLEHMFFKRVDGTLVVWAIDSEEVETCA